MCTKQILTKIFFTDWQNPFCVTPNKESTCNAGDSSLISGSGRSTGEGIGYPLQYFCASLAAQLVKNPPAMWETWVRSLGWKDPLEKESYPLQYSGLEIPWTVYSPWGYKELDKTEWLFTFTNKVNVFHVLTFSSAIHIIHQSFKWFPSQKCHL